MQSEENLDAKRQVQLSLHVFRSRISQIKETVTFYTIKTNVTITWKETSLTKLSWVWVQGTSQHVMTIEPLIGTCSHKQNFPCDDQVRIDDIVIESKTSGLNLKKKMHKRSWGTILCIITNPQGTCSKITFTGAESKFRSLFGNIFFHNAIDIITLSVWVTST